MTARFEGTLGQRRVGPVFSISVVSDGRDDFGNAYPDSVVRLSIDGKHVDLSRSAFEAYSKTMRAMGEVAWPQDGRGAVNITIVGGSIGGEHIGDAVCAAVSRALGRELR